MSCRRTSLPYIFVMAFLVSGILMQPCFGQQKLTVSKTITGQKYQYEAVGRRCVHRPIGEEKSVTATGDSDTEACTNAMDGLTKAIPLEKNQYIFIDSNDGCCQAVTGLCPDYPSCKYPLSVKETGGMCGKYSVKVSCTACGTGGTIRMESTTDHPHIEAIRARRDFRKYLRDNCLECNGSIKVEIKRLCDCCTR